MDGEQEAIAEVEPESPAIEPEMEANEPENIDEANDELEIDEAEPEEDLEEFDWNGKKIKAPKGLKDGLMMQADYTRKTQEVAEQRKELEQRAQAIAQQAQLSEEELSARGQLVNMNAQLAEFAKLDWDQLEAEDPVGTQQLWWRYQTMEKQAGQIAHALNERHTQRTQQAQQEVVKRVEQTQEWAKKNIKGWTPEADRQVIEWAKSKGATDQNLLDAMSPMVYEMLYLARIGEQSLKKLSTNASPKTPQKPLETVGARSNPNARKSIKDMSMEEYAEYRRKGGRG